VGLGIPEKIQAFRPVSGMYGFFATGLIVPQGTSAGSSEEH
jgi:hypothetical protein